MQACHFKSTAVCLLNTGDYPAWINPRHLKQWKSFMFTCFDDVRSICKCTPKRLESSDNWDQALTGRQSQTESWPPPHPYRCRFQSLLHHQLPSAELGTPLSLPLPLLAPQSSGDCSLNSQSQERFRIWNIIWVSEFESYFCKVGQSPVDVWHMSMLIYQLSMV